MNEKPVLGIQDIQKLLPHRYPFLLVDRILSYDLSTRSIVAQKNVTINEPFLQDISLERLSCPEFSYWKL